MSPVTKTEQSAEEQNAEERDINLKKRNVANALTASLDIPELVEEAKADQAKEDAEKAKSKKGKEDDIKRTRDAEGETDEEKEEREEAERAEAEAKEKKDGDAEDYQTEDGEDLIPKSKLDKIIAKQEKRIKALTKRVDAAEKGKDKSEDTRDPETVQLEQKSVEELRALKRVVRKKSMQASADKDNAKVDQLLDLEEKIDTAVQTAPLRFHKKQVALYDEVVEEISNDPDIEDANKAAPIIKKTAEQVYKKYPLMRRAVEGQAMALRLATEHYKMTEDFRKGTFEKKEETRKKNVVKKKIGLGAGKHKGDAGDAIETNARKTAFRKGATITDKKNFVKSSKLLDVDAFIPDEYKNRG